MRGIGRLGLMVFVSCALPMPVLSGCGGSEPTAPTVTVTHTESSALQPARPSTSHSAQLPGATTPGIGEPVRDGSFQFVVQGVRRASAADDVGPLEPDGERILVDLTVTNIGLQPARFFNDSASLVIDGKQHSADTMASVYLSPESAEDIQPGLSIDVATPFDVPVGSVPEAILLDGDIFDSSVIRVDLNGAPR